MTRRLPHAVAIALAAAFVAPSVALAHGAVQAVIVMTPGQPRAGETCTVEVSVLSPSGSLLLDKIQSVRMIGEMTGHNMTPVDVHLRPAPEAGRYAGTFALTMSGPWQLTLRINVANEEMWAVFPVEAVRANQTGNPARMGFVVEMRDPVGANVLSPWVVVGWTLGLIVLFEATAIVLKLRGGRSGTAPAVSGQAPAAGSIRRSSGARHTASSRGLRHTAHPEPVEE